MRLFPLVSIFIIPFLLVACQAKRVDAPAPKALGTELPAANLTAPSANVPLNGPRMTAHFIYVGQGDCTLLEFPCGLVLIDCGSGSEEYTDELIKYLDKFFKKRPKLEKTIKAIISTHPHIDHTRATEELDKRFNVLRWIDNAQLRGSGAIEGPLWIRRQISNNGSKIILREVKDDLILSKDEARKGTPSYLTGITDKHIDPVRCDSCDPKIRILSGQILEKPDGWNDNDFGNANNHSLVIRVDFGESSFLFTGDLETSAIETLVDYYAEKPQILDVDVYQVGHHASRNGTTRSLMSAMSPRYSIISMSDYAEQEGRWIAWVFGHPHRVAYEMLEAGTVESRATPVYRMIADGRKPRTPPYNHFKRRIVNKKIYATGWEGTIRIHADLHDHIRTICIWCFQLEDRSSVK